MALNVQKTASQFLSDSGTNTHTKCMHFVLSLCRLVTTLKCRLLGLHFKIEINEITGVNQKEVLLSSGPRPI